MNCTWKQTNGEIWVKATMHPNKSYFFSTLHVLVSGHWLRSAVIQAEGLCCSDGYGVQGVVWSYPDTREVTARYLYYFTTVPEARRKSRHCGARGRGFDSPREHSVFVCNPAIMILFIRCAHTDSFVRINQCNVSYYNDW